MFTTSTSVTLTLHADNVSAVLGVMYSNDGIWGDEIFEEGFSETKSWTLLPGDGVKTVYYRILDVKHIWSTSYSDTIILDTLPPTGSIIINGGNAFAASASVTLTLTANDPGSGVDKVRFSDSGSWSSPNQGWEAFSSTKSWTLPSSDGGKTVYYQIRDVLGQVSMLYSDTIVLDTVAPAGSIVINGGAEFASSASVTLTLTASDLTSGVFRVRYSDDGVWDTESWESFSGTKLWTLSSGEGTKTVYYQVSDNAGSDSTFSDTIVLDVSPPTGSIVINDGATVTSSASVTLSLTANDPASGVSRIKLSNDGVWDTEPWTNFASTKDWTLSSGNGVKTVYYQIEDNAGITSLIYSDTITLSTLAPTGSIVINGDDDFTSSESVTLSLTYEDEYSDVSRVRYSNDGVWNSEVWETPTATKSWTLTSDDGTKTVYYQIRNTLGLVSSTYSDTIVLDNDPPTGSIIINGGAASTTQYSVTLDLTASDPISGVYQVRYSNDGVWNTESWENFSSTKAWTLSSGEGSKTVYYQIIDRAELVSSTFSDSIILESTSPTPTPSPTPTSTTTPTPTPGPSASPSPSNSPTPSPEPTRNNSAVIPPEAFYATAAIGVASIGAIVVVALKKPKNSKNADDLTLS